MNANPAEVFFSGISVTSPNRRNWIIYVIAVSVITFKMNLTQVSISAQVFSAVAPTRDWNSKGTPLPTVNNAHFTRKWLLSQAKHSNSEMAPRVQFGFSTIKTSSQR